jgi:hypothetical protein
VSVKPPGRDGQVGFWKWKICYVQVVRSKLDIQILKLEFLRQNKLVL